MQGSRDILLTLICVWFSMISGEEVEMKVRAGDNVTIYSDCVWKVGFNVVWFKNSSQKCEASLITLAKDFKQSTCQGYSFKWNTSKQTYDLMVKNVSESDLGLYYCALHEKKVFNNKTIHQKDVYHFGNRTTRLSLLVACVNLTQATSTPSVPDCSVYRKMLVSVCSVCVLLSSLVSSTCVYCICRTGIKAEAEGQWKNKCQNPKSSKNEKVEEDEVCYALLDLPSRGQKHLKKKRRDNFSTFSEVKYNVVQQ